MKKKVNELEGLIDDAIHNIREDRAVASKLLIDLIQNMNSQSDHQSNGLIAAKYLETLQRSNEQLTKLIATIGKHAAVSESISEDDIYRMIEGESDERG